MHDVERWVLAPWIQIGDGLDRLSERRDVVEEPAEGNGAYPVSQREGVISCMNNDSNHRVPSEHSAQHTQFSFALNHGPESTLKIRSL